MEKLEFDYFGNSDDRPLAWSSKNGEFLASAGMENFFTHLFKNKEKHTIQNLLSFAHENNAKVMIRMINPKGFQEIAFPFLHFTDIYTEPQKAIEIFKRAIEEHNKRDGYDTIVSTKYKNDQTPIGKALFIKKNTTPKRKAYPKRIRI